MGGNDATLYEKICNEFLPVFRKLAATDVYSITLGGSHGKGMSDRHSDYDFRIYYEIPVAEETMNLVIEEVNALCAKWEAKNVKVDGIFPRTYAEVDGQLELWLSGNGKLMPYEWTVWGYSLLTDINNQQIIEDPHGRAAQWKERLTVYPKALKESIVQQHGASLEYWRKDYHYQNKVARKDIVFLASLTARLIQDIIQIIYALNEFYYPGDGMNLEYTKEFDIKPGNFEERVAAVFHISESDDTYKIQYKNMSDLIDDTLLLVKNYRNSIG